MFEKPKLVYTLVLLWIALSAIFVIWGGYSLTIVIDLPNWSLNEILISILYFGYTLSTIIWFVFSSLFLIFAYGTFRRESWVWTTGLIITTIFLAVFGLMLASFMVTAVVYPNIFSLMGLETTILAFLIDLGIVFHLTRPVVKIYFEKT